MGALSAWHIALIVVAALLLFGGGRRIFNVLKDAGEGFRAFRDGLKGDPPE